MMTHIVGYNSTNRDVCYGHGKCIAYNTCKCDPLFQGGNCDHITTLSLIIIICSVLAVALVIGTVIGSPITAVCIRHSRRFKRQKMVNAEITSLLPLSDYHPKEDNLEWMIQYEDLTFLQRLSEGSFGVVFSGTYRSSPVAIKKLKTNTNIIEEFEQEVNVLKSLRHPNIVVSVIIIPCN